MTSTPAMSGPAAAAKPAPQPTGRFVTDAPTRMFHWLFALSFLGAYLSADGERWRALHETLGWTMAALLAFRVGYGLFGPRHVALGPLLRRLRGGPAWLRASALALRQRRLQGVDLRQGQNLAMALAIVALLALVLPLTLSGWGVQAEWADLLGDEWLEELHEGIANAVLALVLGHLALITTLSLLRRRNLAQPMLSGRVDGSGPSPVKRQRGWLAVLLLLVVMAFVAWQWQQSPQGLLPLHGGDQVVSAIVTSAKASLSAVTP